MMPGGRSEGGRADEAQRRGCAVFPERAESRIISVRNTVSGMVGKGGRGYFVFVCIWCIFVDDLLGGLGGLTNQH